MLRTFLHPTRILPFRGVVAASSFGKARSYNLAEMFSVCSQISLFSTSETRPTLLTTEDTKKMLVADLKEELKKRGGSQQGKKADLLQRLNELLEKENCFGVSRQISSTINQIGSDRPVFTADFHFKDEFQKLDLALSEKDPFLFEESIKRMESKIRSTQRLSSKEKNLLASKLQTWTKMDSVDSESVARVLMAVGNLGLTTQPSDENRGVVEGIIDKYLKAEIKSTSSITNFLQGLYKVGLFWTRIPRETKSEIETAIVQVSEHMNVEEIPKFVKACYFLQYTWYLKKEISQSVPRSVFNEGNPLYEKNIQNGLAAYINELTDMGFPWVVVPKNVKLTIFQELEKQIFRPLELPKLFSG
jgi:predicted transcriptional regulator